jgi:hypothetical protein
MRRGLMQSFFVALSVCSHRKPIYGFVRPGLFGSFFFRGECDRAGFSTDSPFRRHITGQHAAFFGHFALHQLCQPSPSAALGR